MTFFSIEIKWETGKQIFMNKETKWNSLQVRSWLARKYPSCQYIYIVEHK